MAENFGLNGEVKELKIGRTFEKNSGQSAFHTVRYDFKPASVDSSRDGVLTVDENKSVSITVPHLHGNGQTNFSGRVKNANPKECILIIDRETGEITLETLSSQILVKKTRPERNPDPVVQESTATPTPANSNPPPTLAAPYRPQMPIRKEKPPVVKPTGAKAPPARPPPVKPPAPVQRTSSPIFLGLPIKPEVILPTMTSQDQKKASAGAVLSESSSSSDSSSDESSSSSDSGSDNEDEKPRPASANVKSMPSFMSGGSTAVASSQPSMPSFAVPSSTSMPSFNLPSKTSSAPPQGRFPAPLPQRGLAAPPSAAPPAISMPQFLNDDLQLSESDDSD